MLSKVLTLAVDLKIHLKTEQNRFTVVKLYMCVCIYVYIYTHTYTYIYIYIYIYIYTHICIYMCTYIYMYMCVYICMYIHICVCMSQLYRYLCMYIFVYVCVYVCMCLMHTTQNLFCHYYLEGNVLFNDALNLTIETPALSYSGLTANKEDLAEHIIAFLHHRTAKTNSLHR